VRGSPDSGHSAKASLAAVLHSNISATVAMESDYVIISQAWWLLCDHTFSHFSNIADSRLSMQNVDYKHYKGQRRDIVSKLCKFVS